MLIFRKSSKISEKLRPGLFNSLPARSVGHSVSSAILRYPSRLLFSRLVPLFLCNDTHAHTVLPGTRSLCGQSCSATTWIFCEIGWHSVTHFWKLYLFLQRSPVDIFAKLAWTMTYIFFDQPLLIAPHRDYFSLFRIHIRKIRYLLTWLVTFTCILSHWDRGRSSRERGLQALPRLSFMAFSSGFSFCLVSFVPTPC